jgi:hypothetical protein
MFRIFLVAGFSSKREKAMQNEAMQQECRSDESPKIGMLPVSLDSVPSYGSKGSRAKHSL